MLPALLLTATWMSATAFVGTTSPSPNQAISLSFIQSSRQITSSRHLVTHSRIPFRGIVPSTTTTTTTTTRRSSSTSSSQSEEYDTTTDIKQNAVGLYRPFAEHAWSKLQQQTTGDGFLRGLIPPRVNDESSSSSPSWVVPPELSSKTAPAKGFPDGSVVRMEIKALRPEPASATTSSASIVRYARYALLETLVPVVMEKSGSRNYNSTVGIQVLNLVIFPSEQTNLPVFGADLVSLPGDKHLLLLDAQPMEPQRCHQHHWKDWYERHVTGKSKSPDEDPIFAWGGDIPEQVAKYVSDYALWTRLGGAATAAAKEQKETGIDINSPTVAPITLIQTKVWDAFQEHLDLYLDLLSQYHSEHFDKAGNSNTGLSEKNEQEPYIHYRLNNDPAKPMLKSLYGEEFTERVLQEVLFPQLK